MRVNLISKVTMGVDMKSNPLSLGNRKLQSATNIVFDEGNIRSRYGVQHTALGIKGQFQGAHEHRSSRGISAGDFGDGSLKLCVVADGKIHLNDIDSTGVECEPIIVGDKFSCKGDVNIFSAENYLIFQNRSTNTFWWDGQTLTKSPGTIEQNWDDPEVDFEEVEVVPPTANIPVCYTDDVNVVRIQYIVLNQKTNEPVSEPNYRITYNGQIAYEGIGGTNGQFELTPVPRRYRQNFTKQGFVPIQNQPIDLQGSRTVVVYMIPYEQLTVNFTVIDDNTEAPIEDAQMMIKFNGIIDQFGYTDEDGKFSFPALPDNYTYSVVKMGYKSKINIPVNFAENNDILVRLETGSSTPDPDPWPGENPFKGLTVYVDSNAEWVFDGILFPNTNFIENGGGDEYTSLEFSTTPEDFKTTTTINLLQAFADGVIGLEANIELKLVSSVSSSEFGYPPALVTINYNGVEQDYTFDVAYAEDGVLVGTITVYDDGNFTFP